MILQIDLVYPHILQCLGDLFPFELTSYKILWSSFPSRLLENIGHE